MDNVVWVDENDNILGEISRAKAHRDGLLHRVAVIYVINNKNDILVNDRAKDPKLLDHSSSGHVDVGESYLEAAQRELEEELGIANVELQEIGTAMARDKGDLYDAKHMFKIFMVNAAPQKLQEEEVKRVFWAKPDEILKDMKLNPQKYTEGFKSTLKVFMTF